jgi:hypothetical protein
MCVVHVIGYKQTRALVKKGIKEIDHTLCRMINTRQRGLIAMSDTNVKGSLHHIIWNVKRCAQIVFKLRQIIAVDYLLGKLGRDKSGAKSKSGLVM